MNLEDMKKIAEARTFGRLRIYQNPMRSDGVFLGEDKEIKPYEGARGLDGPLYPAVPQDAWMLYSQLDQEKAEFFVMAANNFDKLLAVVEAAKKSSEDIDQYYINMTQDCGVQTISEDDHSLWYARDRIDLAIKDLEHEN